MFSQKQKIAAIIQVIPILQGEAASNSDRVDGDWSVFVEYVVDFIEDDCSVLPDGFG